MPEISAYHRDIGICMPRDQVLTIQVTCNDYFSDGDIFRALGLALGLCTVSGLVSVLKNSVDLPIMIDGDGQITGLSLVMHGDHVDFDWNEPLY
ncbi:MAG: hypothetical protein ACYSYU_00255 [Planctomycetota bacterium]|jgi:hypothetical protein